ncbi:serine-rich adhesin for platelets-like [Drosophila obscura]|uniref:serine-rich adhesin for platelets-like n=1 Tax=Drosophila obscura TaxID=7282 RepID=UPI001BB204B2|nr:serine-rich adhesin for platelets-like [Drosophila obscura]
MRPETSRRASVAVRRYCGLGNHLLKTPNSTVRNPKMLHFARRMNRELRDDMPLCKRCYDALVELYELETRNALAHRKKKEAWSSSEASYSDTSSTTSTAVALKRPTPVTDRETSSEDSMPITSAARNALVHRKRKEAESSSESSSSLRQDVNSSSDASSTTSTAAALKRPTPVSDRETSSEDSMSTKSAAAAEKRKRSNPPPAVQHVSQSSYSSYVSDDDDPNSNLSLNAVNGTRLPHIQPIPKRRRTSLHLNKAAMDIYLAGTTGG